MGKDCHFEARGNTMEEVKKKMIQHVEMEHPELMKLPAEDMKNMEEKMDAMMTGK